tara:strand:+ start:1731 stop:3698 length:1968 start_codon:yes stop_codon:yes gene_type:complete
LRIKDAKGSPLSWTQPIATQRFAEFILFDYLAEGSTGKGTEDYAERVDPDDVKEKNFGSETYDENKFITVYKKALSALKNKSLLSQLNDKGNIVSKGIIDDDRFQLRLKSDIESFLKTNEIGKELAQIKLKDLTSQKLASVFRDTKATKASQSRIRQGLTQNELDRLKTIKDNKGDAIFNVEEKSHRNKNKKTKIITFNELSNDAYLDNIKAEIEEDGIIYEVDYPKAFVLFDAGFVREEKDLRNILLPSIITSKKIQQETKTTIGGGDDEKLSLESSPLYRKQVIPIATTTGREQKTAADSLEVIFGKQYEDTEEGKKAVREYSKLKRETDKLKPVFDDYIDRLRGLLLERNPALRDIESYIKDATEEEVDAMFDRLDSPEEEKDFRAKEEKIIEETTEKEREKTQGFVKDFLKEIVDEPVSRLTISDLKRVLSEVKIGGKGFGNVADTVTTHGDMLSQMRVIGYNNPQNNPLKAKHLLLLPDFDKSRYEIELGKSKNSGDLLKPIFKNYLANKRKFIDKRIKESDKGLPARDAKETETSEMLEVLYNNPNKVLDKEYFGETIGDVTKVMDFRLVIDRFAFTGKDSDGETTTSYTYSLGKFDGKPSTIKYKNVNLRKLQMAYKKDSQPDLESTRTARDFIFDIKEELNILEREV